MDKTDIMDALYNAAGANEDREVTEWDKKARVVSPRAVAKFRTKVIAFLGECPEDWTISELLDMLAGDREPELDDEEMTFAPHRHET